MNHLNREDIINDIKKKVACNLKNKQFLFDILKSVVGQQWPTG
jgi:hypothetical protein